MFVVCFTKHSPILSLNVVDKSVTIFKDTIYSDLDGIAIDDPGRIFFSSWQDDTIIEIPQEQNVLSPPEPVTRMLRTCITTCLPMN